MDELLLASRGTGVMYRRWQPGDILITDDTALIVKEVINDGTPEGQPVFADEPPTDELIAYRRSIPFK